MCFAVTSTFTSSEYVVGRFSDVSDSAQDTIKESAVSRIKQWSAYEKEKYPKAEVLLPVKLIHTTKDGKSSSLKVDEDGKLNLDNMTAEDALLLLVADDTDRLLREENERDYYEAERKKALADVPPPKFNYEGKTWPIWNIPQYTDDVSVLATTNCGARWIKVRDDRTEKRTSVMHEMMHVATGCSQDENLHKTIYAMAPALLKLFQNNPDVVKYLMEKPKESK